jgi:3-oxoacyl-[acyl-carrier protein] reductase
MAVPSALVLGGGGGIGAAVSRRLAATHAVMVGCWKDLDRAKRLVDGLAAEGSTAQVIQSDATSEAGVVAAFDAAEELGDLRVVVHCVGGWDYPRITDLTEQLIDDSLALNLGSALLALRESARRVVDGGRVVLLSSAAAQLAPARQSTYAAAKAGLEAAARVAAKEVAARGITVNVVRPGATDTEAPGRGTSPKAIEAMSGANAMRRLGTPDDIAGAVLMLCAADSGWVTGAVIDATGGLT